MISMLRQYYSLAEHPIHWADAAFGAHFSTVLGYTPVPPQSSGAMDGHRGVYNMYNPTCTYTQRHNNHAEQLFSGV